VRAALTGQSRYFHSARGSCKGVFERLLVLCADNLAVASSIALVVNQPSWAAVCKKNCSGAGCEIACNRYRGRLPAVDVFARDRKTCGGTSPCASSNSHCQTSLAENAQSLVAAGLTNEIELRRVLGFNAA